MEDDFKKWRDKLSTSDYCKCPASFKHGCNLTYKKYSDYIEISNKLDAINSEVDCLIGLSIGLIIGYLICMIIV